LNTVSPLQCPAWAKLVQHAESWRGVRLRELFAADDTRGRQFVAEAPGLRYDYSRQRLGAITLRLLAHLAAERGFAEWREALLAGSEVNSTEKRAAWHTALRAGDGAPAQVKETLGRMKQLVGQIRSEAKFKRVINLGTGGSDLGPRLLADALGDAALDVRFAGNFFRTAPGFTPEFKILHVAFALALAAGWVVLIFYTTRSPMRSVLRWAAGIVLLWGTGAMLLMPWADYQKSYRSVALQLRSKIPVGSGCIAQKALGVSQAAALDYHGGIRARPFDFVKPNACPLLLVQGSPKHEFDGPGAGWVKLADVGRPGDRAERYRLYRLSK